jgi:hypothetical protein
MSKRICPTSGSSSNSSAQAAIATATERFAQPLLAFSNENL